MTETPRPEFDPRRSAAFRAMLGEEVTAATADAAPATRHRSRRTAVLVTLATLVALVATGTAAVALTGGTLLGAPAPVATTSAPTPTAADTPTPTATPSPTPAPTAPPAPAAPISRIPATCDDLLPQSAAEAILGRPLGPPESTGRPNPMLHTAERVGALSCVWSSGSYQGSFEDYRAISLSVVPDVSDAAFTETEEREGVYLGKEDPSIGPESFVACTEEGAPSLNAFCSFLTRVDGYGIQMSITTVPGELPAQRDPARARFIDIRDRALSFGPPAPLWQPVGPTIAGAGSCEELIDPTTLDQITGDDLSPFKSEGGENMSTPFLSSEQVGAFYCGWLGTVADSPSYYVAELPGGAQYLPDALAADTETAWTPAPGYPGDAYLGELGSGISQVHLAIDSAWISVSGPGEILQALTEAVVEHLTAQ